MGTMAGPWTGWLLLRSLETLKMRMTAQAMVMATSQKGTSTMRGARAVTAPLSMVRVRATGQGYGLGSGC